MQRKAGNSPESTLEGAFLLHQTEIGPYMILAATHSQEQSNPKWGKRQRSKRECLHIPPKNSKRTGVCNHFAPWGPLWVRGVGGVAWCSGPWDYRRGLPTQWTVLPYLWGLGSPDLPAATSRRDPTRPERPERPRPDRMGSLSPSDLWRSQ